MCYIFGFNHFLAEVMVEKGAMMCSRRALQLKGIDDSETKDGVTCAIFLALIIF